MIRNRAGEPRALRRVVPHPDVDLQQFVRLRHDHAEELAFADRREAVPASRAALQTLPDDLLDIDIRLADDGTAAKKVTCVVTNNEKTVLKLKATATPEP